MTAEDQIAAWLSRNCSPIRREGVLTKTEVAKAATAYLRNGLDLFDDARLLASKNRLPRASALVVLGLEEIAKIPQLVNAFLRYEHGVDDNAWRKYWKVGGRHGEKQAIILSYGNKIRKEMDGDPMFRRKLYRHFAPDEMLGSLDKFKQSNFYVDIRQDGVHEPARESKENLQAFDYLMAFGQERADSFCSWHITEQRSLDYLDIGIGQREAGKWSSYKVPEVRSDLLYYCVRASASHVPDYLEFYSFIEHYKAKVADARFKDGLLELASIVRKRAETASSLPIFGARYLAAFKLLVGVSQQQGLFGKSFRRALSAELNNDRTS